MNIPLAPLKSMLIRPVSSLTLGWKEPVIGRGGLWCHGTMNAQNPSCSSRAGRRVNGNLLQRPPYPSRGHSSTGRVQQPCVARNFNVKTCVGYNSSPEPPLVDWQAPHCNPIRRACSGFSQSGFGLLLSCSLKCFLIN